MIGPATCAADFRRELLHGIQRGTSGSGVQKLQRSCTSACDELQTSVLACAALGLTTEVEDGLSDPATAQSAEQLDLRRRKLRVGIGQGALCVCSGALGVELFE